MIRLFSQVSAAEYLIWYGNNCQIPPWIDSFPSLDILNKITVWKKDANAWSLHMSGCLLPTKPRVVKVFSLPQALLYIFVHKGLSRFPLLTRSSKFLFFFLFWKPSFIINDSQWLWRLNISRSHTLILMFQLQVCWEFAKMCSKIIHMPGQPINMLSLNWNDSIILKHFHIHLSCVSTCIISAPLVPTICTSNSKMHRWWIS